MRGSAGAQQAAHAVGHVLDGEGGEQHAEDAGTRPSVVDSFSASQVRTRTTPVIANTSARARGSFPACPTRIIMLAIEPGPAMSGMARGKTLTSGRERDSSSSSSVSRSWGAAITIPTAMRNSRMPPAIRKASMLIPSCSRSQAPPSAKPKRTPPATTTARRAIRRRSASGRPSTRPR